ncbi:MAG: SPFH domain-containing protein [Lachnospiraceae bacterium]|nr:SPFH domain-containing protein [Lachnospiraceae bacterium]
MGLFDGVKNQLANVVEWEEWSDDMIFWKWTNKEIKKGSKLIIRPGQDAIFLYNGAIEGIFRDDGEYDIESQIIPFLSTLKGFKFGFNSGMRAEVLFVNTKEFLINWGTQSPVNIPTPAMPGGMPVRANGTTSFSVTDYTLLIEKIAGVKNEYRVDDVKERITTVLNELLMKHISTEGKDMFNLQANASEIGEGIRADLSSKMEQDGISVTKFSVNSFNYPQEIQDMINKNAATAMVGDVGKYQQVQMTEAMANGKAGNSTMSGMAEMMVGMQMANQMVSNMNNAGNAPTGANAGGGSAPKFCPNCGTATNGANFCSNCGAKLV